MTVLSVAFVAMFELQWVLLFVLAPIGIGTYMLGLRMGEKSEAG